MADVAAKTDILKDPVEATNRQSITTVAQRSVTFSSVLVGQFRAYVGEVGACLALPAKDCGSASGSGADGGYNGYVLSPLQDYEFTFTVSYDPGLIKPGKYDALQSALDAATLKYASGAAFSLGLV